MPSFIHKGLGLLADVIFPRKCYLCLKPGSYFCAGCRPKICRPEAGKLENADLIITFASYRDPAVKKALRKLKYGSASDLAEELAEIAAEAAKPYLIGLKPLITAIPMTDKRKGRRGFNQAETLAQNLARELNLEFMNVLIKIKETRPQAEIKNREERFLNIKNAFAVKDETALPEEIIVVDDIITTGATMSEAARILKSAGVKKVIGVAVAR